VCKFEYERKNLAGYRGYDRHDSEGFVYVWLGRPGAESSRTMGGVEPLRDLVDE
jgi:hypothetical protein